MINKKITAFIKNISDSSFEIIQSSTYIQKVINQLPHSRNNLELDREYASMKTYNNVIRL